MAMLAFPTLLAKPCLMPQELFPALTLVKLSARTFAFVELATIAVAVIIGAVDDVCRSAVLDGHTPLLSAGWSRTGEQERAGGEACDRKFCGECFDSSEFHDALLTTHD